MKREDITSIFPDATKEQIDKLMGINGEDINKAKGELEQTKKDLTKAQTELQTAKNTPDPELEKANKQVAELQKELGDLKIANSVRDMRERVADETGVKKSLLTFDTEEACRKQAQDILAFAKVPAAPNLPNPGEPGGNNNPKPNTARQFATWAQSQFT